MFTDYEKGTPTDSVTLTGRRPWYSLEYNDGISALSTEPYGMTDNSRYSIQHQIGNKQYELSNHLGNVLATVSDLKHPVYYDYNGDTVLHHYTAAIPAAYDYYPFGMLMPGRYVSDTSSHCQIISRNEWFTTYEDSCYTPPKIKSNHGRSLHGSATAVISGSSLSVSLPDPSSTAILTHSVSSNAKNTLSLTYASVSAPVLVSVAEEVEGVEVLLAQHLLSQGGQGSVSLDFVPKGTAVAVHFSHHSIATAVLIDKICISIPVMQSETYLVELCDEEEDRYRFGFNDMHKDNEWAGVGNSLDFGARVYDSRSGRFLSLDPLSIKFPSESNYIFAGNSPIVFVDIDGEYKLSSSFRNEAKILSVYLDKYIKNDVKNSQALVNGLMKYGQFKKESDIYTMLSNANGPEIKISDTLPFDAVGYYSGGKDGSIFINRKLIIRLNEAKSEIEKLAALLNIVSTIFHESVHYGDWQDGTPEDNQEVMYEMVESNGKLVPVYKIVGDKGHAFENEVYFDNDGINTIDLKEDAKKVIKKKSKENEDKSVIPTMPSEK